MNIEDLRSHANEVKDYVNIAIEKERLPPLQAMQKIVAFESHMTEPCIFNVGDWVMPKENAGVRGHGHPHRVIVTYNCMQIVPKSMSVPCAYYDMLVLDVYPVTHYVAIYAVHSADFEPYTGVRPEDIDVD